MWAFYRKPPKRRLPLENSLATNLTN